MDESYLIFMQMFIHQRFIVNYYHGIGVVLDVEFEEG